MAVTIRDVAREAGVSISTVSRALASPELVAEPTRSHVQSIAHKMGYRPNRAARGLITGRSGSIGLVVPDLENPFFGSVCKGVQARARAAGYTVFFADTDEDAALESEIVHSLLKQVDGVILCSPRTTDAEIQQLATETPLVLANRHLEGIPSIKFDNASGVAAILRHLMALGHRKIAYAGGPPNAWANRERTVAFEQIGAANPELELIELGNFPPFFSGGVEVGDLAIASGATAVVAYNDIMALGVIDRLRQRGLTAPRDLSVTGFDNVPVSTFVWPNLTTIDLPRIRLGRTSLDLLVDLIEGSSVPGPAIELPVELIVRQSTGIPTSNSSDTQLPAPSGAPELLDADV